MGSFAKRARALAIFTGLVPFTAAQAQTPPECKFELKISKIATAEGGLFTKDSDPAILGRFQLKVEANKVKPNNKALLVSPTAMLSAAYYWDEGPLSSYDLEVRNPYTVADGEDGPSFDAALTIEGSTETYTMATYSFSSWDTLVDSNAADKFGSLKKDVTLALGPPDGDPEAGKAYTFTFPKADIAKAYKAGAPQLAALMKKAQAGQCNPSHQVTSSGGGGSVGCFLTTATCEAVGLADDCWELRTLRRFRDGWLARQQGGNDDIAAYYAKAPAIAARLKADPRALLQLYWTRIVPSALAAQFGANQLARAIYSRGMRELAAG